MSVCEGPPGEQPGGTRAAARGPGPWKGGAAVGEKAKVLCEWKRAQYRDEFKLLRAIVVKPKYVCLKCGRVADKKKWLCEPIELE